MKMRAGEIFARPILIFLHTQIKALYFRRMQTSSTTTCGQQKLHAHTRF